MKEQGKFAFLPEVFDFFGCVLSLEPSSNINVEQLMRIELFGNINLATLEINLLRHIMMATVYKSLPRETWRIITFSQTKWLPKELLNTDFFGESFVGQNF